MRILRGLTSRLLPCGCVAGVYETYDGEIVTLLDDRQATCTNANHENGNPVPELFGLQRSEVTLETDRQRKA
jgi:hypothetical protein